MTLTGGTTSTWGLATAGSQLSLMSANTVHVTLTGTNLALPANIGITAAAGTSAFNWSSATGAFSFPTGNVSWTAAGANTFLLTGPLKVTNGVPLTVNNGTKGWRFVQAGGSPDVWQWDGSGFDAGSVMKIAGGVILGLAGSTLGFFAAAGAVRQTIAALTNSVTPGGTANTINNIGAADVDITAADLTDTRDAMYQMALKVDAILDMLHLHGLAAAV